jgi:serine/threonine protein kinase
MPLPAGTRIGPYAVGAGIGAGGMGEVYRARDTRLERDVALKVLPQNVSDDPERLLRLQREARTLAALNHPNIAHVYGLENADGLTAIAMELVEGPILVTEFNKVGQLMPGWDVNADGSRFLVARQAPNSPRQIPPLTVIQNWFAEFKNRR